MTGPAPLGPTGGNACYWRAEVSIRLTELAPRWVGAYGAPVDAKQGISFLCPHCQSLRLAVFFDAAICSNGPVNLAQVKADQVDDGEAPGHLADHHIGRVLWHRDGDTFENLTLTPSIDASHFGHWHGNVTAGNV